MDNNETELQGRIEALARQRNIALDEAVFHAGRYKSLQAECETLKKQIEKQELEIADLNQLLDRVSASSDAPAVT